MEPSKKKYLKEIIFALQLGSQVLGSFLLAVYIGLKADAYLQTKPMCILTCLLLAFIFNIKTVLGVIKND